MTGEQWIQAFERIPTREDLPISIQGGEPTIHPDFYWMMSNIFGKKFDLLTNGKFNLTEFMGNIHPGVFMRKAPYASIRFSYHKDKNDGYLTSKLDQLKNAGYSVGVWGFDNLDNKIMQHYCKTNDIDFRTKEMLDETHGTYKYPDALSGIPRKAMCKSSELLIAPDGKLYRCHSDLYSGINSYGHILDKEICFPETFIECDRFGFCNRCDIKVKFDRFQVPGHCSVEIQECE